MPKKAIEHRGIISAIENGIIIVDIQVESACASCEAHGSCMSNDSKTRSIAVSGIKGDYKPGQWVTVLGTQKGGLKAVFLAYFLPFLLILATLIISSEFTKNEIISGFISLGILVPYYALIWLLRSKISKSFQFELKH